MSTTRQSPCVYRGPATGDLIAYADGRRKLSLAVFACHGGHGLCTVKLPVDAPGVHCCATCADYDSRANPTPHGPPPPTTNLMPKKS